MPKKTTSINSGLVMVTREAETLEFCNGIRRDKRRNIRTPIAIEPASQTSTRLRSFLRFRNEIRISPKIVTAFKDVCGLQDVMNSSTPSHCKVYDSIS